jgi:hypothetical protein
MTDAHERADADLLAGDLHADSRGYFIATMGFEYGPEPDDRHAQASLVIDPYIQAEELPWPNVATLLTLVDILVGRLASHHTARAPPVRTTRWRAHRVPGRTDQDRSDHDRRGG